ncbi:hypothetical protein CEXT_299601 [Caerostris extrusa]|uniref:Uncharacterized protein n=1 Tax=Caerostris extrusa TaxID=172846 RepID=A0AAV4PSL6_CAEEX|nr:hypothetical protein CEXT_299601 [Caerostris extrusa]
MNEFPNFCRFQRIRSVLPLNKDEIECKSSKVNTKRFTPRTREKETQELFLPFSFPAVLSVSGLLHQPKPPGESSGRTCLPSEHLPLISSDHIRFISSFLCTSLSISNGKIIGLTNYKPLRSELTVFSFSTSVRSGRKETQGMSLARFSIPSCLRRIIEKAAPSTQAPENRVDGCFFSPSIFPLIFSDQSSISSFLCTSFGNSNGEIIGLEKYKHLRTELTLFAFSTSVRKKKKDSRIVSALFFPAVSSVSGLLHQPKPPGESSGRTCVFPPSISSLIFFGHTVSSHISLHQFQHLEWRGEDAHHSDDGVRLCHEQALRTENVFKGCMSLARFNLSCRSRGCSINRSPQESRVDGRVFSSEHLSFDLFRSHPFHLVISLHQFQHFEWKVKDVYHLDVHRDSEKKETQELFPPFSSPAVLSVSRAAPSSQAPRRVQWTDVCFPSKHLSFDLFRSHPFHLVISLHQSQHLQWRGKDIYNSDDGERLCRARLSVSGGISFVEASQRVCRVMSNLRLLIVDWVDGRSLLAGICGTFRF